MRSKYDGQRGATLFVTLIALVVLTLLAIVAIRSATLGLRIGGNAQAALEAEAAAQAGIDRFLSNIANFETPPSNDTVENITIGGRTYNVTIAPPSCKSSVTAPGYSLVIKPGGGAPVNQVWQISATASQSLFGASVGVVQGVKVRMPVGAACPN